MFGQFKRYFFVAMMMLISAIATLSQTAEKKPERNFKAEGEVFAVTQQWADAMTRGDLETLGRLFSDDLIVTLSSGKSRGKKEQLETIKRIIYFNLNDLRLNVNSTTALTTCYAQIRYNANEQEVEEERQYTTTLVNQQGQWRIVAQQINITSQRTDNVSSADSLDDKIPSSRNPSNLVDNSKPLKETTDIQSAQRLKVSDTSPPVENVKPSIDGQYRIGQRIPAGEFALTVLSVEKSPNSYTDTYAVKSGNTMLAVEVKLETQQWSPFHTIGQQDVSLIGRLGTYRLSPHGGKSPSFHSPNGAFGSGKSAIGWLTFEVSNDELNFVLSYKSWDSEYLRVTLVTNSSKQLAPQSKPAVSQGNSRVATNVDISLSKPSASQNNADPKILTRTKMQTALDEYFTSQGRATGKIIDFRPNPAFGDYVQAEIQISNFTYRPTAADKNELLTYSGTGRVVFQRSPNGTWALRQVLPGVNGHPWMPTNVPVK